MLSGLVYLEQHKRHYPYVGREYVLRQEGAFVLLNPHCFNTYIRDCFDVYLSRELSPLEKHEFFIEKN